MRLESRITSNRTTELKPFAELVLLISPVFRLAAIMLLGSEFFVAAAHGQETNAGVLIPRTKLEAFETNTGVLIIKGTTQIGTISAQDGIAAIRCKEITDGSTGHRAYGISVGIKGRSPLEEIALVDYDEIDSLLGALDSLNKVEWSITSMAGFEAVYTTKGGLRLVVFGRTRSGTIQYAVSCGQAAAPLLITRDQMAQFRSLGEQAKNKLDSLRSQK